MSVDISQLWNSADKVRLPQADIPALRSHYAGYHCAQIAGLCDVTQLRMAAREAYERLREEPVRDAQEHEDQAGRLGYGFRLSRLDPKSPSPSHTARVESVFAEVGLTEWADRMARAAVPFVSTIVGTPLAYERLFLLSYGEGDYIGPHGAEEDSQDNRFNLQFPLCFDAVGCMRVLKNGYLELMYDRDGDARLLGPNMWHEVPPLLRLRDGAEPLRLVVSLRLVAATL